MTRAPTDAWTAQQLREATPYGHTPKYLIRDNDCKFGPCFARVAATSGIKILKTPSHAPRANAICERFLGSVRRECLDHMLVLNEKQLHRVLRAYVEYFNRARPHQGIHQQVPQGEVTTVPPDQRSDRIISVYKAIAPRKLKKSRANPSTLRTDVPSSQHNTTGMYNC